MNFFWPWIFLLLPLPLFVVWHAAKHAGMQGGALRLPPNVITALEAVNSRSSSSAIRRLWLPWLLWILTLLALAQPYLPEESTLQQSSGRAVSLLIDVSESMKRDDFELDGISSDRLSVVKRAANDFIKSRVGDRLSLVLFGDEAFVASPLSFDLQAVSSQLNASGIGMAGSSTAIGDGIGLAIQTLRADKASDKAIVLLSDGTNNAGSVEPESAAQFAESLGIRIHTIALGSDRPRQGGYSTDPSADLDEAGLKAIAEQADGTFFRATTTAELQEVYALIDEMESAEVEAPAVIIHRDLRNPVLILILLFLLLSEVYRRWLA